MTGTSLPTLRRESGGDNQKDMQLVFRVPLRSYQGTAAKPGSHNVFHGRKSHRKSRRGCRNCRQRHVKCDENKDGGCQKCQSRGIDCDYNQAPFRETTYVILPKEGERSDASTPSSTSSDSSLVRVKSKQSLNPPGPVLLSLPALLFSEELPEQMTPIMQTLRHYDTVTYSSMGSDMGQKITKTCMYTMIDCAYLLHAIHGVAAAHLCHLLPASQHPIQHHQNKLAAAYHWQRCLRLFRQELDNKGIIMQNMDALLSTVMLISTHQFMLLEPAPDPSSSFVFAPAHQREDALRWLSIHFGFKVLWHGLGAMVERSVWLPVFQDADVREMARPALRRSCGDEVHDLFLDLCDIDTTAYSADNPYYDAVGFLLFLRRMKLDMNAFNKLITFVSVIDERFHRLLLARDKRALLILAHWLALMTEIQQWWISGRTKTECIAITTFLMHDPDARVRRLLEYPAKTAGIKRKAPDIDKKASFVIPYA